MSLESFLKRLANPRTTPAQIRRAVESRKSVVPKTIEGAPPRVDEISSEQNPATPGGSLHPGPLEMQGVEAEPAFIRNSRPRPGKLGEGAKGPER
jgi:hypothetical protein